MALQVFLYVNQHATLRDTTGSTNGSYHRVEAKDYPVYTYSFENLTDLERYWYEMHRICMHTQLGAQNSMIGKEVTFEVMDKKPALIHTLRAKTNLEVCTRKETHRKKAPCVDISLFTNIMFLFS